MRPTTEVRGATPDEMPRAIAAIVAAFLTDPIARFAWPSPHDHLRAMPLATREFASDSFDYGTGMSPPTSAAPRSGCLPGYMRPSTMRAGVGSHGLGCWPVARKRRSAVATRAIPARTRNPPAASVTDGGNGKRNGQDLGIDEDLPSRKPRRQRAEGSGLVRHRTGSAQGSSSHALPKRSHLSKKP
jgi:hypothetical protein